MPYEAKRPVFYPFKSDSFCLFLRQAPAISMWRSFKLCNRKQYPGSVKEKNAYGWTRGWQTRATQALIGSRDACYKGKVVRIKKMRGSPELQKDTQETPSLRK